MGNTESKVCTIINSKSNDVQLYSKNSDHLIQIDFNDCENLMDAECLIICIGRKLRDPVFKTNDPHNLTIELINTGRFRNDMKFIKYCYILMEYCLSFQNFVKLNVAHGKDFLYAELNQLKSLQTNFFVFEFDSKKEQFNKFQEYFFLQKSLLETYYLNTMKIDQLQFISDTFNIMKNQIGKKAVKPKGYFIYIPKEICELDNLKSSLISFIVLNL